MFNSKKSETLLARIREGMEMSRKEKLSLYGGTSWCQRHGKYRSY